MFCVRADDETIELFARHAGEAGLRLEVEGERAGRDKGFGTAAAGTAELGRLVDFGIHVLVEVILVLEVAITIIAVVMTAAIGIVLLPRIVARKVAIALVAWPVGIRIFFVLLQGPVVRERSLTAIAIRHG
jgi:hypothetical protein